MAGNEKKINKVVYGGTVLIDLTQDDVTANDVVSGKKFHLPDGNAAVGASPYDADTSDATALASEILSGKTAYKAGSKLTGTMPNNGAVSGTISTAAGTYTVPQGYHDGSGTVAIDATEQSKIVASNIRQGVEILGVTGSMTGTDDVSAQGKIVTPRVLSFTVTPDAPDYNYLSQVVVQGVPYTETDNAAGGRTSTIC